MNRKLAATVMIILMSALGLSLKVHRVEASGTIYIRADGSVEGIDKIQREGNIYIFVDDINGSIVVDRDNITIDGAGYTLQGIGGEKGVDPTSPLLSRLHVPVLTSSRN